jgi:hypothetical protein
MYPAIPPAPENDGRLPDPDPEYDVTLRSRASRRRARWPAILRLSVVFRILAVLHALFCLLMALISVAQANRLRLGYGFENVDPVGIPVLLMALVYLVAAAVSLFFWLGMAELLVLFVEVERNTRQAALQRTKERAETPLDVTELAQDP